MIETRSRSHPIQSNQEPASVTLYRKHLHPTTVNIVLDRVDSVDGIKPNELLYMKYFDAACGKEVFECVAASTVRSWPIRIHVLEECKSMRIATPVLVSDGSGVYMYEGRDYKNMDELADAKRKAEDWCVRFMAEMLKKC
jgi:hypothetical protein